MHFFILLTLLWSIVNNIDVNYADDKLPKQNPDRDITTLLVISNENRTRRFPLIRNQNIRPSIGLITSTVRTFIANGQTTEYATEIYGTTLNQGKIYAQILSTTSRIRENLATKAADNHHEDHNNIDNRIDFLQNKENPYFVFPTQAILMEYSSRISQQHSDIEVVMAETTEPMAEKLIANEDLKKLDSNEENELFPKRITPTFQLPTITVMNNFAPGEKSILVTKPERKGRKIIARKINGNMKVEIDGTLVNEEELKSYETVRYYGFADFTTLLGSTVIIFQPYSSANHLNFETVLMMEAIQPTQTSDSHMQTSSAKPIETPIETKNSKLFTNPKLKVSGIKVGSFNSKPSTSQKFESINTKLGTLDSKFSTTSKPVHIDTKVGTATLKRQDISQSGSTGTKPTADSFKPSISSKFASLRTKFGTYTSNIGTIEPSSKTIKSTFDSQSSSSKFESTSTESILSPEIATTSSTLLTTTSNANEIDETNDETTIETITESNEDKNSEGTKPQPKPLLTIPSENDVLEILASLAAEGTKSAQEEYITSTQCSSLKEKTILKTLTYHTTFFEPDQDPSVESNVITTSEIELETHGCDSDRINPTSTINHLMETETYPTTTETTTETTEETPEDNIELVFKTFYTTFTYLTTYFSESTASTVSRKETITNIVTSTLNLDNQEDASILSALFKKGRSLIEPTSVNNPENTDLISDAVSKLIAASPLVETVSIPETELIKMQDQLKTILTTYTYYTTLYNGPVLNRTETYTNYEIPLAINATETLPETLKFSSIVTSVINSSSNGQRRLISGDDQLSLESNNNLEGIPLLLLQTKFTTYTYYTTTYEGLTSSSVTSRFETITDIVTETVYQHENRTESKTDYPVTFFTTFTYWTTLFIDGTTTVTSQKETISSVSLPPTLTTTATTITPETLINSTTTDSTSSISSTTSVNLITATVSSEETSIHPTKSNNESQVIYTYYTTSYLEGKTIINSRLETENIINTSPILTPSSSTSSFESILPETGLIKVIDGTIDANETTTVYQSKIFGSIIDGTYSEIIESTSEYFTSTIAANTSGSDTFDAPKKTRLAYKPKKSNFSLQIRPFASRNRAEFNPRRRNSSVIIAATITRSDISTPTILATQVTKFVPSKKSQNLVNQVSNRFRSSKSYQSVSLTASNKFRIRPSTTIQKIQESSTSLNTSKEPKEVTTATNRRPLNSLFKSRKLLKKPIRNVSESEEKETTTAIPSTEAVTTSRSRLYTARSRPHALFVPGRGFQRKRLLNTNSETQEESNPERRRRTPRSTLTINRKKRQLTSSVSRFRRPITHRPSTEKYRETFEEEEEEEVVSIRPKPRYKPRKQQPTPPSSRLPFTLRSSHRKTPFSNPRRFSKVTSTTPLPRSYRNRNSLAAVRKTVPVVDDFVPDSKLVVTYRFPVETTIPIVNGRQTDYKKIITENLRTETLNPHDYYTSLGDDNRITTLLSRESTVINQYGVTEVTKFNLRETVTSSVEFTPTFIRGRKTTYSHILPSTIYNVENTIETIQSPLLAAQAPLANILLSQLLLGGTFGPQLPQQQQQQQQQQQTLPIAQTSSPSTEYKVRTTSYVTTVTSSTSTIVPLIFRGRQILTTIIDTSTNVITATEFLTDTVVITPTVVTPNVQNLNSLLLPLLLQQQQQQQGLAQSIGLNNEYPPNPNELLISDHNQPESSILTIYKSGKKPGDFTSSLSTIYFTDLSNEKNLQKREIFATKTKEIGGFLTTTAILYGSELFDYFHTNHLY